jgi:hypothetical protein
MFELLALPGWNIPPTPLARWVEALEGLGQEVGVTRESSTVSWVEVRALSLRGYAVMDGLNVQAINFELAAPDPSEARQAVEQAALALAWEVDDEQDEAEDSDYDD